MIYSFATQLYFKETLAQTKRDWVIDVNSNSDITQDNYIRKQRYTFIFLRMDFFKKVN